MLARHHIITARLGGSRHQNRGFFLGIIAKYALLALVSVTIWRYVGDGAGKVKYHGVVLGGIAAYLAIQEVYFQMSRAKINEPLNSPAIDMPDLEALYDRVIRVKAHLDMLWKITVPIKFFAVICGLTLYAGGNSKDAFYLGAKPVTWDDITGTAGWLSILVGIDLTWRTFSIFRHIDAFNTKLSVKAKEIAAQKEAAAKLREADPGDDWPEDPTPEGYSRFRLRNPS